MQKQERLRLALRDIVREPMIYVALGVILAQPVLQAAIIYGFLRSFLIAPSGLLAYLAILLLGSVFVFGWIQLFRQIPALREARLRGKYVPVRHRSHIFGHIALLLAIGPLVALTVWSDMQRPPSIPIGKRGARPVGPREQLESNLRALERRGIFTWIINAP